ncbi:MAG: hypothetical protein ACR2PF_00675 [Rhizobiaceae bacterium]
MRYSVGLGRQGFEWSGTGKIQYKCQWPKWTPPEEMIAREPELKNGVPTITACNRGRKTRSALARSTFLRKVRTRFTASMLTVSFQHRQI